MEADMKIRALLLFLVLPALALAQTQSSNRTHLMSKLAAQRNLPFSSGVIAGDTLYVAGTIGLDPSTANKNISAEEEARSAMNQVKQVVEQAGMTMDDVVSVQVFCTDLANYDAFNRVYRTYFHGNYPARAFVGVDKLLFGARYEIMATAVKSPK
jgi:2-iminobutanoate/2-iminopropanoate deaminase